MRIFEQIFLQTRQKFAGILSYGKNFSRSMQQNLPKRKLATPEGAADVSIYERHGALKKQLDEAVNAWEEASLELEEAQS